MRRNDNRTGAAILGVILLALAGVLLIAVSVEAEDARSISAVCNEWMSKRVTVGVSAASVAVDFSDSTTAPGWGGAGSVMTAQIVIIKNRDSTDTLLWDEFLRNESVTRAGLATPTADIATTVDRIAPAGLWTFNDISWVGVELQNEDDVSDSQGTIDVDVRWCY